MDVCREHEAKVETRDELTEESAEAFEITVRISTDSKPCDDAMGVVPDICMCNDKT